MATLVRPALRVPRVVLTGGGLLAFIALLAVILTVWSRLTALPSTVLTSNASNASPACPAPCWYAIRPGETTVGEVLTFLPEQPFVQGSTIRVWPASGDINQIAWSFQRPAGDTAGYAYFESDRCTAVTIIAAGALTLADAFGKFGQPERVWTQTGQADARAWVEVDLVYPAAGYVVEVDVDAPAKNDPPQVTVGERTPVMRVTYFAPRSFQALLADSTLLHGPAGLSLSDLRPWPGLGPLVFTRP